MTFIKSFGPATEYSDASLVNDVLNSPKQASTDLNCLILFSRLLR
jgi:hypothetical protein